MRSPGTTARISRGVIRGYCRRRSRHTSGRSQCRLAWALSVRDRTRSHHVHGPVRSATSRRFMSPICKALTSTFRWGGSSRSRSAPARRWRCRSSAMTARSAPSSCAAPRCDRSRKSTSAAQDVRRPGRHRDRERASAQRAAPAHQRPPSRGAADCRFRGTASHLQLRRANWSPCSTPCWRTRRGICEAKFGNLALLEGNALRMVALHGAPPAYAEERQRTPLIPLELGVGPAGRDQAKGSRRRHRGGRERMQRGPVCHA